MRISGLSSGMDTEQMIKDIMTVERIPVDRVFQQKVKAEWKQDAYRDVNTKLLRLRNMSFDLSLQGTYQKNVATSSHDNLVSVEATGSAQTGTFDLIVNELAESARFHSAEKVELNFQNFIDKTWSNGEEASFTLKGPDGTENIKITKNSKLKDVLSQINESKNLGISAYYDSYTDKVSLTTIATGVNAKIEVLDDSDGFSAEVFGTSDVSVQGKNAEIELNGLPTQRESNTFDFNGTNITLYETNPGATVRINIRQDADAVVDKVKEFVDLYNEVIGEFNLSVREDVYRDFPPLTNEQRAELSDKEIEQWEEKARSGLLRSDRLIGNVLSEMRMALGASVQGLEGNKTLAQIGIKTGGWYENGKLYLDEGKLKEAVIEDAEGVRNIFTQQSEVGKEQGLARRLTKVLDDGMKTITDRAGKASSSYDQSFLGKQIRDYEDRLSVLEERLLRVEQSHWDKFTVMERMLGQLYAQSDWLYQQLAALQG